MKMRRTHAGLGSGVRRVLAVAALAAIPVVSATAAVPASAAPQPTSTSAQVAGAHTLVSAGYDMVGSDGGVFVFGSSTGFYGSLPGIGVHVHNIVGMVGSANGGGYFLVGSDGGVFSFGSTGFYGSLPGIGVRTNSIVGIVATADGGGYYLVGRDGGVFAFGDAPYIQSLPGKGIQVSDVTAIVAKPDLTGYWLIERDGTIWGLGTAAQFSQYQPCYVLRTCAPFIGGASTSTGNGLWLVNINGDVDYYGDANFFGDTFYVGNSATGIPSGNPQPTNIVSIVSPFGDDNGYFLVGADGGIFNYGTTSFFGSLPGIGVHVSNIVGAVPTVAAA